MTRALIIGLDTSAGNDDDEIEEVARYVSMTSSPGLRVERCAAPADLVSAVMRARDALGGPIDVLDLYYHGAAGCMFMGQGVPDTPLFRVDRTNSFSSNTDIGALATYLSNTAKLRLLGCHVGKGSRGQKLLQEVAGLLGPQQTAYAPIDDILFEHFTPAGFDDRLEDMLLYSSRDATRGPAPTWHARVLDRYGHTGTPR